MSKWQIKKMLMTKTKPEFNPMSTEQSLIMFIKNLYIRDREIMKSMKNIMEEVIKTGRIRYKQCGIVSQVSYSKDMQHQVVASILKHRDKGYRYQLTKIDMSKGEVIFKKRYNSHLVMLQDVTNGYQWDDENAKVFNPVKIGVY